MDVRLNVGESKTLRASVLRAGQEYPPPGNVSWTHWAPPGVISLAVNADGTATVTGLAVGSAGCSAGVYQFPVGWSHWQAFNVLVGTPHEAFQVSGPPEPKPDEPDAPT